MAGTDANRREPMVCIVDDDAAVRRALARLVDSIGVAAVSFASPADLFRRGLDDRVACLVLDVRLPGVDGFELNDRLVAAGRRLPVIFITAHHDEDGRARARHAGAVAFLAKPFDEDCLLAALRVALGTG